VAIGDLYTLSLFVDTNGNPTENVLGFEQISGGNGADTLEALAQAWIDNASTALRACLSDEAEFSRVLVNTVTANDEVPGLIDNINFVGTNVGEALPANMAACFNLMTDAPNSKHNGRIFLAGCPENEQAEGTWDPAMVTLLNFFAVKLGNNLIPSAPEDSEFKPVVISRFLNGIKRVPPIAFTMLTATARVDLRQQRGRKTGCFGLQ